MGLGPTTNYVPVQRVIFLITTINNQACVSALMMTTSLHLQTELFVFSDLQKKIEDSYTPTPLVMKLDEVYNVREWLGESKLKGHSGPLCFEFVTRMGGTIMRYRDRSTDPWQMVQGEILEVINGLRICFADYCNSLIQLV